MSELLNVSSNPHVRSKSTTSSIMFAVVIALLPATGYGIYNFGIKALLIVFISCVSSVLFELLFDFILKKKNTIGDFSALVTGLLLALNLPATVPWWIPVLGSFFAIVVVKLLFGGLGQNIMNPALAARCFLLISFTSIMTNFNVDGVSSATPLSLLKNGESVDLISVLTGSTSGTIGETSAIAIMIGAAILIFANVIDIVIPATYIFTFVIGMGLLGAKGFDFTYLASEVCSGGLMLGAFFMATDYTTRPVTKLGQFYYGILLGILTCLLRVFGTAAEGVSYAIIIGNLLVPLIEKISIPSYFGKGGSKIA